MWLLVANGLVYLGFIYLHGEWRDLVPRRRLLRDGLEMVKFYLALRKRHPHQGKHNVLQRTVYFVLPWVGAAAVVTGIAIWKPVQLGLLTHLLGGYVWARYSALPGDGGAGRADARPRLHGLRRRSHTRSAPSRPAATTRRSPPRRATRGPS